jgi:hypothetical protein
VVVAAGPNALGEAPKKMVQARNLQRKKVADPRKKR